MENYIKGPVVGDGTFSKVYRGVNKETGRVVALKKIKMGFNSGNGKDTTADRELAAVRALRHPHVIGLVETFKHKQNTIVVYEFMESDLEDLIRNKQIELPEGAVKAYMKTLLEALSHCHSNNFLHRDIKPNNLLLDAEGTLRLADFGLAKEVPTIGSSGARAAAGGGRSGEQQDQEAGQGEEEADEGLPGEREPLTPQVSHVCYKPPELMLGDKHYGPPLDVWAAGCVFAELMLRKIFFPGKSDIEQLHIIFEKIGSPPEGCFQDLPLRDFLSMFQGLPGQPLEELFAGCAAATPAALALLRRMLDPDPRERISAAEALEHEFFCGGEPPAGEGQLPKPRQWKKPKPPPVQPRESQAQAGSAAATLPGSELPTGGREQAADDAAAGVIGSSVSGQKPTAEDEAQGEPHSGSKARTEELHQGEATPVTERTGGSSRNSLNPPPSFSGGSFARADSDGPPLSKIKLFDSGGGSSSGAAVQWAPGPRGNHGYGSASKEDPHPNDHTTPTTAPRLSSSGTTHQQTAPPAYTVTTVAAAPVGNNSTMGPPSARLSSLLVPHRRCPSTDDGATAEAPSSCGGGASDSLCPSTAPPPLSSSSRYGSGGGVGGFRRAAPGATPAIPMSGLDLDGSFEAPTPSTGGSLRKRKLDMDAAMLSSP